MKHSILLRIPFAGVSASLAATLVLDFGSKPPLLFLLNKLLLFLLLLLLLHQTPYEGVCG